MPLPAWGRSDLPQPPPYGLRNAVRVIGPGTLLLAISLGCGDWLLGPVAVARHGSALLAVALISILLQSLLNTEMARYTLATGEPIWSGFMRTWPGRGFWGGCYAALHWIQLGWPGWALAAGATLAALFLGRAPRSEDHASVMLLGYLVLAASIAIVVIGRGVRAAIERAEPVALAAIAAFLLLIGLWLVPGAVWAELARGFLGRGGTAPADLDWALVAAFAAYSGAGGAINATLTHWVRDKGFGMASMVGGPPVAVAGRALALDHEGTIFPTTPENLAKWTQWWRYVRLNLGWVWTAGCVVSMGLPVLLTLAFVDAGTEATGLAGATLLARGLAEAHGYAFWFLVLGAGFWILFSIQIGIVESFARSVTDIVCTASARARERAGLTHLVALACFTAGALAAMALGDPLGLVVVSASVAAVNLVLLALHTLWVTARLLPPELRPPRWRQAGLVVTGLFFSALVVLAASRPGRLLVLFAPATPPLGYF